MIKLNQTLTSAEALIDGLSRLKQKESVIIQSDSFDSLTFVGEDNNPDAVLTMQANPFKSGAVGTSVRTYTRLNINTKFVDNIIPIFNTELELTKDNLKKYLKDEYSINIELDEFIYDSEKKELKVNGRNWFGSGIVEFRGSRKKLSESLGGNPSTGPGNYPSNYPLYGEREWNMTQIELWCELMNSWLIKEGIITEAINWGGIQLTFVTTGARVTAMKIYVPPGNINWAPEIFTFHYKTSSVHFICYERNNQVSPMPLVYPKDAKNINESDKEPLRIAINTQYNLSIPKDSSFRFYYDSSRNYCIYDPYTELPLHYKDTGYFVLVRSKP